LLAPIVEELIYVVPTKADVSLQEAAKYNNVLAYPGYRVIGLHGGSRLEEITVVDGQEHREVIKVDALFVELGFEIRIDFIKPYVDVNERGEVLVDRHGATRTEGLFAAGDLVNIPYKQAVISAASGVVSALSAINYVNAKKGLSKNLVSDWRKARSSPKGLVFRL
ncbi:MAG: NAD(P)/FAD-dependent oxidoreductase, partial [Ignisphaera sp.]|nr:NAD(P)/FAD-dependent oxidoreductase [Ignisphaera sp.]